MKSERNATSDEIAKLKKSGVDAAEQIERLRALGKEIEKWEQELKARGKRMGGPEPRNSEHPP